MRVLKRAWSHVPCWLSRASITFVIVLMLWEICLNFSQHVSLIESCKLTSHTLNTQLHYKSLYLERNNHSFAVYMEKEDFVGNRGSIRLRHEQERFEHQLEAERALGSHICFSALWTPSVNKRMGWWKIHLLPVSLCRKSMLKATLLALQQGHLPHSP